jgi:uncharacterized protein (TIGR02145 family)
MKKNFTYLVLLLVALKGYSQCGTVTDYDGNVYNTVTIGTQCWMQENLKTSHYNNGVAITNIEDSLTWVAGYNHNFPNPAFTYYNADSTNNALYGKLYTFYAVSDTNQLCPTGWHVPTYPEWVQLSDYLGGKTLSGGHLKDTGTVLWRAPNTGGDDSSGFNAEPAGFCTANFRYDFLNNGAYFWSSTIWAGNNTDAWDIDLYYSDAYTDTVVDLLWSGFSVRCIHNNPTGIQNLNDENDNTLQIFPNPGNGNFIIKGFAEQAGDYEYQVYDVAGRLIETFNYYQQFGFNQFTLNLQTRGIYFVRMIGNNTSVTQKLVVE